MSRATYAHWRMVAFKLFQSLYGRKFAYNVGIARFLALSLKQPTAFNSGGGSVTEVKIVIKRLSD